MPLLPAARCLSTTAVPCFRPKPKGLWLGIPPPSPYSSPCLQALPEVPQLDQATLNEYTPGVGLAPHIDTHSAFDGPIISLSLAGGWCGCCGWAVWAGGPGAAQWHSVWHRAITPCCLAGCWAGGVGACLWSVSQPAVCVRGVACHGWWTQMRKHHAAPLPLACSGMAAIEAEAPFMAMSPMNCALRKRKRNALPSPPPPLARALCRPLRDGAAAWV